MFKIARKKAPRRRVQRPTQHWNWQYPAYGVACFFVFVGGLWLFLRFDQLITDAQQWALMRSQGAGFVLRDIAVEGRERTDQKDVLKAVSLNSGDPLWALNPKGIQEELEKTTWVETAVVQRRLPDTLYIQIEERTPLALWQYKGKHKVIDAKGSVIEGQPAHKFKTLVKVVGQDASYYAPTILATLQEFPQLMKRVTALTHQHGERWDMRLDGRVDVKLPEANVTAALVKLKGLEEEHDLSKGEIMSIDLRFPDKLILRLTPEAVKRSRVKGKDV